MPTPLLILRVRRGVLAFLDTRDALRLLACWRGARAGSVDADGRYRLATVTLAPGARVVLAEAVVLRARARGARAENISLIRPRDDERSPRATSLEILFPPGSGGTGEWWEQQITNGSERLDCGPYELQFYPNGTHLTTANGVCAAYLARERPCGACVFRIDVDGVSRTFAAGPVPPAPEGSRIEPRERPMRTLTRFGGTNFCAWARDCERPRRVRVDVLRHLPSADFRVDAGAGGRSWTWTLDRSLGRNEFRCRCAPGAAPREHDAIMGPAPLVGGDLAPVLYPRGKRCGDRAAFYLKLAVYSYKRRAGAPRRRFDVRVDGVDVGSIEHAFALDAELAGLDNVGGGDDLFGGAGHLAITVTEVAAGDGAARPTTTTTGAALFTLAPGAPS